ncbi:MAG: glycosyltransferase family 4 protein [Sedimentisphaerales bacterium]|nr:glycosyltransferase family 4 protein [Sedimentisphaerales bacterium]
MIKLAHVVTSYQSVVTILDAKLRHLDAYPDLQVCVISSADPEGASKTPAVRHIPVEMARSIRGWQDLKSIWRLYRVFRRERFDIVHSHTAKAGFITALAARLAGVPCIVHTYHGLPYFDGQCRLTYTIYRLLEKLACLGRHHVFTQNRRDQGECVKLMASRRKVSWEGNGVDIDAVRQSAQAQRDRARAAFTGRGAKLVLLSRLEPVKRVPDFFSVVEILCRSGLEVTAVVAGGGPLADSLGRLLQEKNLQDKIHLTGFCDYPHGLLAAADVVCLCSEKEGIPRAVMEAMALARPVVATDVLGSQELVLDGQTGFLTPLGDPAAMARRVRQLLEDPPLRERLGRAGRRRIAESFDETRIAGALRRFYLTAAGGPERRRRFWS